MTRQEEDHFSAPFNWVIVVQANISSTAPARVGRMASYNSTPACSPGIPFQSRAVFRQIMQGGIYERARCQRGYVFQTSCDERHLARAA
ncbi:hypothetical protein MPC1_5660003 [Methylocella tundrae]|nr:hypothetical protein MPC1_5660003 [Methylocella tundrae]